MSKTKKGQIRNEEDELNDLTASQNDEDELNDLSASQHDKDELNDPQHDEDHTHHRHSGALSDAIFNGSSEDVRQELERRNPKANHLVAACQRELWEIAELLIDRGAKSNFDSIMATAMGGCFEAVRVMHKLLNEDEEEGKLQHTHFVASYQKGFFPMAEYMVNYGMKPVSSDLLWAVLHNDYPLTTLFLRRGHIIATNEHVVHACLNASEVILTILLSQETTIDIFESTPIYDQVLIKEKHGIFNNRIEFKKVRENAFTAVVCQFNEPILRGILHNYAVERHLHTEDDCCDPDDCQIL